MQILDYNRTESSALVFPCNLQCVEATSWSELKSCFIAYFTVCEYAMIIPGPILVNLPPAAHCTLILDTGLLINAFPRRRT